MRISLSDSLNKSGIPAIQLSIMGGFYWFIVDTGSNTNRISSAFPPYQKSDLEPIGVQDSSGLGGHLVSGATYRLKYKLEGNFFQDAFSIVDSATFDVFNEYGMSIIGILGTEFMIHHKAVVDFADGTITLNGQLEDIRLSTRYPQGGDASCDAE